jgi:predicted ATPase
MTGSTVTTGSDRFFVITGGPGSGKTALATALANRGYGHVAEGGRAIIQNQVAIGGKALPWSDRRAFAELMLDWEIHCYRAAEALEGPVFFDRGVPDVLGYLRLCGLPVPARVETAAQNYRYHRRAFIAPPWAAIFRQDAERKQSFREAEATYEIMAETYTALGYQLVALPRVGVPERAQFVLEHIQVEFCGRRQAQ